MKKLMVLMVIGALAACGDTDVNPPTEPAAPITTPDEDSPSGKESPLPGLGPVSFIGRWAAQPTWCGNTKGPEQAIEISTTRFQGYENGCDITRIEEVPRGYIAWLACEAEGVSTTERVGFSVTGQTLSMTWLDRASLKTEFTRCPAYDPPPPIQDPPIASPPINGPRVN